MVKGTTTASSDCFFAHENVIYFSKATSIQEELGMHYANTQKKTPSKTTGSNKAWKSSFFPIREMYFSLQQLSKN